MKNQLLMTERTDGYPLSINFSVGRGQMEEAVGIVKDIAENPAHDFVFVLQEPEDKEDKEVTTVRLRGLDALGLVLEYFNDWERQKLLRRAVDETATVDDAEWLTTSMFYDEDWTDEV